MAKARSVMWLHHAIDLRECVNHHPYAEDEDEAVVMVVVVVLMENGKSCFLYTPPPLPPHAQPPSKQLGVGPQKLHFPDRTRS